MAVADKDKDENEERVMISQAPAGSISVVERASSYVDRHLMFFRTLPIVIGGIGLLLVLRHLNHRMVSGWFACG